MVHGEVSVDYRSKKNAGEMDRTLGMREVSGFLREAVAPGMRRRCNQEVENLVNSLASYTDSEMVVESSQAQVGEPAEKRFMTPDVFNSNNQPQIIEVLDCKVVSQPELGEIVEKAAVWIKEAEERTGQWMMQSTKTQQETNRLLNVSIAQNREQLSKQGSEIRYLGVRCKALEWKTREQDAVVGAHQKSITELKRSVGMLTARVNQGIPPRSRQEPPPTRPLCLLCRKDYSSKYFPYHVCKPQNENIN